MLPIAFVAASRRILIESLSLKCRIGAYDAEKLAPQTVLFDCDVWIPLTNTEDKLEKTLNYDDIVGTIERVALSRHFDLQETLVDELCEALRQLPHVLVLRVCTRKTEAYANVAAAGLERWVFNADPNRPIL